MDKETFISDFSKLAKRQKFHCCYTMITYLPMRVNASMDPDNNINKSIDQIDLAEQEINLCTFQKEWEKIVDKGCDDYSLLSPQERVWYNVEVLLGIVGNGGLCAYFCESTVEHVFETIEDLRLLGATDIISLLEKMCSLFPDGLPPPEIDDRMEIMGGWDEYDQLLDDLDNEFFKKDSELEKTLVEYIIQNNLVEMDRIRHPNE